jgi:hypothetical protein
MLGNSIVTGNTFALNFISTHANPADYPSRGKALPAYMQGIRALEEAEGADETDTGSISRDGARLDGAVAAEAASVDGSRAAARVAGPGTQAEGGKGPGRRLETRGVVKRGGGGGLEIFAGTGVLSKAHRRRGLRVHPEVEIRNGLDAMDRKWDRWLYERKVDWVWLSPSCGSFSPLRNLDKGGPLRPRGLPEGRAGCQEAQAGNELWRRAVQLARKAHELGVPVTRASAAECRLEASGDFETGSPSRL